MQKATSKSRDSFTELATKPRERDFIGYGPTPPKHCWPEGKRIAVNFVLSYEEGAEPSIPDGDDYSESHLTESMNSSFSIGERDLAAESMYEYGSRAGIWRIFRQFKKRRLPLTVFACALALERNRPAAHAIRELNFDVCCHGWRWTKNWQLTEDEEQRLIERSVKSIRNSVGCRPLGWYCRHGPSLNTRRLLAEEGGFIYDSDAYNDDLPYWERIEDKPHLVIPYSLANNDIKFAHGSFSGGQDFFEFLRDSFDVLYGEGATSPKMMSVGLHARITGHPARAAGLIRFLDYISQFPDVWVCRRIDIARHWLSHHKMTSDHGPQ